MTGVYFERKMKRRVSKGLVFVVGYEFESGLVEVFIDPAKPFDDRCLWRISTESYSMWIDAHGWHADMQDRIDAIIAHYLRLAQGRQVAAMIEKK